jgi:hypothetical protein
MKKVLLGAALLCVLFSGSTCIKEAYEVSCRSKCEDELVECKKPLIHIGCESKYDRCIDNCR